MNILTKEQEIALTEGMITSLYFDYFVLVKKNEENKVIKLGHIINSLLVYNIKNNKTPSKFTSSLSKKMDDKVYTMDIVEKTMDLISEVGLEKLSIEITDTVVAGIYLLKKYYDTYVIAHKDRGIEDLILVYSYLQDKENFFKFHKEFSKIHIQLKTFLEENPITDEFKASLSKENEYSEYVVTILIDSIKETHNLLQSIEEKQIVGEFIEKINPKDLDPKDYYLRKKELFDLTYILLQMKRNNIMVTGESGIGKRTLLESVPIFFKKEKIEYFNTHDFYYIDLTSLFNPETPVLDFTTKANEKKEIQMITTIILSELQKIEQESLLFFDFGEINVEENYYIDNFMPNLLTLLTNNEHLQSIIISDNPKSIPSFFDTSDLFSLYKVPHPSKSELEEILMISKREYEEYFNITLTEDNIHYMISLLNQKNYNIVNANNFIDMILAKSILYTNKSTITNEEILSYFEINNASSIENSNLKDLKIKLENTIYGQNHVIDVLINKFEIVQAGLKERNKPIASFMFSGNSGTGKTEIARRLAEFLNTKLLRYDMSEFQESHSVSKFLGSPAGYVGYEEGAPLIKDLEANPRCILLLDEIEKAHPNVIKLFLQVLEEASIKGSNGANVDLSNVIIIFTTNAGAKSHTNAQTGFIVDTKMQLKNYEKIKTDFPIEFINRLDEVIYFNELNKEDMKKIIAKEILNVISLLNKEIKLTITENVYNHLLELGYDVQLGARKIKRVVEKELKLKLAKTINASKHKKIKAINIDFNEEFVFTLS